MSNKNINVELFINRTPFKQFKQEVDFTNSKYDNLLSALRTIQGDVNGLLTEIVESEEESLDDSDEPDEPRSKRKTTTERNGKKMKTS